MRHSTVEPDAPTPYYLAHTGRRPEHAARKGEKRMKPIGRLLALVAGLLLLIGLAACEDTAVHTTPPAPVDSEDAPTIQVEPSTVGPNVPITVTGAGFPPDTTVEVHLNPVTAGFTADPLGQGQTDGEGRVTLNVQMPALWLDGTPITGPELLLEVITEDGDVRGVATVPFEEGELESFVTIDPPSGAVGQQMRIDGQGFEPGRELAIRIGPREAELYDEALGQVTVDDNGEFQTLITLPTTWPGADTPITEASLIIALVDASSDETVATASFNNIAEQVAPTGTETPAP